MSNKESVKVEKVFDLTREIKERRIKRGIVDELMKLNLNFDKNPSFEDIQKKVMSNIIIPIMEDNNLPVVEKIEKLHSLINTGEGFNINIRILALYFHECGVKSSLGFAEKETESYKKELVEVVVEGKHFHGKVQRNEIHNIPVEVTVSDGNVEGYFLSMLDLHMKKKVYKDGGRWSLRSRHKYYPVVDLAFVLSQLYLMNKVKIFMCNDKEMSNYIVLKELLNSYLKYTMPSEEDFRMINQLLGKYNLPLLTEIRYEDKNKYVDYIKGDLPFTFKTTYSMYCNSKTEWNFTYLSSITRSVVLLFLKEMFKVNKELENEVKREKDISDDYAKSYETKKNIPLKVQKKMKKNHFLKWFEEVEFDELCDLEKVTHIEKEFLRFAEYINLPLRKDHSLRFRRLGNHKASGLYFPSQKAVCVDIRSTDSMIHELLHMIDYTTLQNQSLSSLMNFRSIVDKYCDITDREVNNLPDDSAIKKQWNSKSKYNKDYFQCSPEIFARCGEIYIQKILGIENSLVDIKAHESLYYPSDEEFLNMIEHYFKGVFGEVGVYQKDDNIASSIGGVNTLSGDAVYSVDLVEKGNGQLCLF